MYAGDAFSCYTPIREFIERGLNMKKAELPPQTRYSITIEEAAGYSLIGENRLRKIIEEDKTLEWVLRIGSQVRIKRVLFERWLDGQCNL